MFSYYGITEYNGKTIIMLLAPYTPFENAGAEYLPLDACYPCVHAAHMETKRLIAQLKNEGIEAEEFTEPVYSKLAMQAGLAYTKGRNSLTYNREFGSRFVLEAVAVSEMKCLRHEDMKPLTLIISALTSCCTATLHNFTSEAASYQNCSSCHMCIKACPVGAIGESGLTADKCLRWHMRTGEYPSDEIAKKAGNAFWGCDICQRVCPMNRKLQTANYKLQIMPDDIKKLLKITDFLKSPKEHTEALGEYIGRNYANVNRLLALCINAAGNSGNKEYAPLIAPYLESKSQTVKTAAERAAAQLYLPCGK